MKHKTWQNQNNSKFQTLLELSTFYSYLKLNSLIFFTVTRLFLLRHGP